MGKNQGSRGRVCCPQTVQRPKNSFLLVVVHLKTICKPKVCSLFGKNFRSLVFMPSMSRLYVHPGGAGD